jgi:hypothetical protein
MKTLEELREFLDDVDAEAEWCENPERVEHDQEDHGHCRTAAAGMYRAANMMRKFLGLPIREDYKKLPELPEELNLDVGERPPGWKPLERPRRQKI